LIDASCREFPHHGLSGVAILALEQNGRLGLAVIHRENHNGARVADHIAAGANAARFGDLVCGNAENGSAIRDAGG